MTTPIAHWRYLCDEMLHRRRRTVLNVFGIAVALALVSLIDILGRGFADLSTLPLRSLSADLVVQRSATESSVPKQMGVILPYSAQPITGEQLDRLGVQPSVTQAAGSVLLWNFGTGRFFTISGISFDPKSPSLGPAKVRDWVIKGRLPEAGQPEILVERHYGAFYKLQPGVSTSIGGQTFTVVGIVDIKQGSQIVASNFYMDIAQARSLANLPPDAVNQVFLKVGSIEETEAVKAHIATWLSQASVVSSDTMLKLFGGISQLIARFRLWALVGGALIAAALMSVLIFGTVVERCRDAAILRTLGWTRRQARRQVATEMMAQGVAGAVLGNLLVFGAQKILSTVTFKMPSRLLSEDPAAFAGGVFHSAVERVPLPLSVTMWDWLLPLVAAGAFCALLGWWLSAWNASKSLWVAIKS